MSTRVTRSAVAASSSKNKSNTTQDKSKSAVSATKSSAFLDPGNTLADSDKPVYFWREFKSANCYLSQWYASPFHAGDPKGILYETAEQYMMHQKALLFADYNIAAKIMTTSSPKDIKALGRKVANFKDETWNLHRSKIVEDASYYKFKYGADKGELSYDGTGMSLKQRFMQTGDRELVEASPMDKIWGIGFTEWGADARRPSWGLNLLGKALMAARERLRSEESESTKEGGAKV